MLPAMLPNATRASRCEVCQAVIGSFRDNGEGNYGLNLFCEAEKPAELGCVRDGIVIAPPEASRSWEELPLLELAGKLD